MLRYASLFFQGVWLVLSRAFLLLVIYVLTTFFDQMIPTSKPRVPTASTPVVRAAMPGHLPPQTAFLHNPLLSLVSRNALQAFSVVFPLVVRR